MLLFQVLIAPWGRPVSGVPRNAGEIWRSGFWWTGWAIGVAFISVGVLLSVTPYLYFASIPGSFLQLLGVYVCVLLSVHALAALTSMRGFFYRGICSVYCIFMTMY